LIEKQKKENKKKRIAAAYPSAFAVSEAVSPRCPKASSWL
jgi:hypothetical protein